MTLATRASILCLFSLIVSSGNQPALGWGVPRSTEKLYDTNGDHTGLSYSDRNQHVISPHRTDYYPDFGYRGRQAHTWHEPHGYNPPPRDNHQRDHGKIHFVHQDHHGREEENPELLSRRISDESYSDRNPQLLGSYGSDKRPSTGHTGKGYNSHRGTSKPRVPATAHRKRNNTHDGDLVFPDRLMFSMNAARCPQNASFCEDKQNYPKEYIQRLLAREGDKFKAVFGQDTITDTGLTQRKYHDENYLCLSTQRVIFPTKAKNKDDKWQFVINQEGYTQGIGVETCLNAEESCRLGSFPLGYRSFCKQKYITRRLLSLNESGGPGMSEFLFPSCCVCVLTTDGPGAVKS